MSDTKETLRVETFLVPLGRLVEIGLPCICGRHDAGRIVSERDGTEMIVCKFAWEQDALR